MNIGKMIKEAREKKNLTQKELSARTNIPISTISGYESGRFQPNIETIRAIAAALGVRASYLVDLGETDDDFFAVILQNLDYQITPLDSGGLMLKKDGYDPIILIPTMIEHWKKSIQKHVADLLQSYLDVISNPDNWKD